MRDGAGAAVQSQWQGCCRGLAREVRHAWDAVAQGEIVGELGGSRSGAEGLCAYTRRPTTGRDLLGICLRRERRGQKVQIADVVCLQRLGECLGKGAFGSVYKAFNWGTGEAVAVKQIKLADLPKSELRMIEVGLWRSRILEMVDADGFGFIERNRLAEESSCEMPSIMGTRDITN